MMRCRRCRVLFSFIFCLFLYFLWRILQQPPQNIPKNLPVRQDVNLSHLAVIIVEFEDFDNDIADTVSYILSACDHLCHLFIVSEEATYPPLKLPPRSKHVILQSDIYKHPTNVGLLLERFKYVLFAPDGTRFSSPSQMKDHLRILLASNDYQVVALPIGALPLNCYEYSLDIRAWELVIRPAPHNEVCDGISGRAAFLMHTSHLLNMTFPFSRPSALSLSIQTVARSRKIRIGRGVILGEGRQLYSSDHTQWKHDTLERERVQTLYKNLGIKKVVGSDHEVQWYGCKRTSPRCFPTVVDDTPSYLYKGRWTPPCCLEGLRITARHVFQTLNACHVRWWLEGGSLLGAVRNGDIIPWDYDVDIGVYMKDLDRCPQLKSSRWQTLEDSKGFVWQKASEGNFFRVHYSTANHLHVDIFPFESKAGMMIRSAWITGHQQDVDFPEHFLRPLTSVLFAGVRASAPNNIRDFLELKFGGGVIENPSYPNVAALARFNVSLNISYK